jgi:hypothetical protein
VCAEIVILFIRLLECRCVAACSANFSFRFPHYLSSLLSITVCLYHKMLGRDPDDRLSVPAWGSVANTERRHSVAKAGWQSSDLPDWLTEEFYLREIQPRLKEITLSVLASKLKISIPYAVDVRSARRVSHPRHWQKLAQLVGFS